MPAPVTTFNGWNVFAMPTDPPAPKKIEWGYDAVIGANKSPFSRQIQTQDWGQSVLEASLTYPPMYDAAARNWAAFLMACRGVGNAFLFGDPLGKAPANPGATPGTVTGGGQTGYQLNTSSSGLQDGDWFSIGLRAYRVTSAAGGTLQIFPPIRESPAGGANLVITNVQGLYRLSSNKQKWDVDEMKVYGFTFEIEEAL